MIRICFVCLGNICRSPTAEGVMKKLVAEAGLSEKIHIESAGTGDWHVGELPDPRSRKTAERRGVPLSSRAQHFSATTFDRFDLVLAADSNNVKSLQKLARGEQDTAKIRLLRDYDPSAPKGSDVPDPYYGGPEGFEEVFDQCEAACRGLLKTLAAASS